MEVSSLWVVSSVCDLEYCCIPLTYEPAKFFFGYIFDYNQYA